MRHLYKMLAVFALLLSFGTAQAQYSVGLALDKANILPFLGVEGSFGPKLPYNESDALIGVLVAVKDIKGNAVACDSIAEDLKGKIAIIDRGTCGFVAKCLNAVKKGAVAVLVANNATGIGVMGGGTDPLAAKITVPCLMITQVDGKDLRDFVAASADPVICGLWHPNAYSGDAYAVKTGTKYFVDGNDGHPFAGQIAAFPKNGALDTLAAKQARFFVYSPTQSGKISVTSCDGKGDTHLNIHEVTGQAITKTWTNGGVCAKDAADTKKTAAELKDVAVTAGLSYYIEFSDKDSKDSFYFSMGFVKRDSVTVKLSVDMKSEAAVDAAGIHVAGSFQGWDPKKSLLKNVAGTKIYEGTFKVPSDQTLEYKFVNGDAWGKDESVSNTAACAAGKDGNRKLVVKTEDVVAATPCFKSCEVCITPAADFTCDVAAVICDPFKSYPNGPLANGGAAHWTTWDDAPAATASPVNISSEQFSSDTKAARIDGSITPGQDAVFKTGNLSKGHYTLGWKMYVPTTTVGTAKRKHAYYNIQKDLTGDHVFSSEVYYFSNGTFEYRLGTGATQEKVGVGKFDADKWFNVSHDIDIDKDTIIANVNGTKFGWKWSRTSVAAASNKQLAGINFYADSTYSKYFVDDIQFIKLPDPKAKVTFSVDMKNEKVDAAKGVCVAGNFQAAAGLGADWTPGKAKLVNKAGTSIWELAVDLPLGNYDFKFINDDSWSGKEEKMTGKGCYAGDNRTFSVSKLDPSTVGTYCYNSCYACNQRAVTFFLDLSKETSVATAGVSMAGDFQAAAGQGADWTPGVILLKKVAGRLYTTTLGIPAGTYSYKFLNGIAWGKEESLKNTDACAAGKDGNRKLVVGSVDMKLDTVCFKYCVICSKVVSTNDPKFDSAMTLYPNPAQDMINLNYDFTATTSLKVNLVNILGQTVYSADMPEVTSGTAILDIHNLVSGTYMVQITDQNNRQSVKRFVVER